MDVFFSDLDNTLIYSHRHRTLADSVVVEYLDGKEQSYMLKTTFESLVQLSNLSLVPVSTRTEPQYRRLSYMDAMHVKYAIICNGGKLLVDGKEDEAWTKETINLASSGIDDMESAIAILSECCRSSEIHRPEIYMCYVTTDMPDAVCNEVSGKINMRNIDVQHDHRKVYLFTRGVDKGYAIRRFKKRFNVRYIFSAGDSIMDIPMLNEADYAFASADILPAVMAKRKRELEMNSISQLCEMIDTLNREGHE